MIDQNGEMIGIISKEEALQKARDAGVDLVEIAPNANPPVARILEFQKFKYEENKKEQAAKKHAKEVELKELWLTPRIAEHDLQTRLNRVDEFLKEGNKIMLRVKFKGREMAHTEFGFRLLQKIFGILGDKITVDRDPKLEGRSITAIIGKSKGGHSQNQESRVMSKEKNNEAEKVQV